MADFKDIGRDLWKDKPLLIVLVVGVIGIVYILWKQNSANVTAPVAAPAATPPASGGNTYVEDSYYSYAPVSTATTTTTTGVPVPTPLPTPHYPVLTIRAASTVDNQRKIKGIPIRAKTDASGATIGSVNFGQTIQSIGPIVTGGFNNPLSGGSGSNQWYPVAVGSKTGYISAYDVANAS